MSIVQCYKRWRILFVFHISFLNSIVWIFHETYLDIDKCVFQYNIANLEQTHKSLKIVVFILSIVHQAINSFVNVDAQQQLIDLIFLFSFFASFHFILSNKLRSYWTKKPNELGIDAKRREMLCVDSYMCSLSCFFVCLWESLISSALNLVQWYFVFFVFLL